MNYSWDRGGYTVVHVQYLMFNAAVFSLSVFSYGHKINVIIECLIAFNWSAWPQVSIKIENPNREKVNNNTSLLCLSLSSLTFLMSDWVKRLLYQFASPVDLLWFDHTHLTTPISPFSPTLFLFIECITSSGTVTRPPSPITGFTLTLSHCIGT